MIDGSKHPLRENIELTKKVIDVAHAVGVSVEAELGKIAGTEDDITVDEMEATFTDPDEAKLFVEETGVDYLAVAVGTAHGVYKGEPKLDFDRIRKIKELVGIPLVLHGSSGVPADSIKKAIEAGINKVNIDTDLRIAFTTAMKDFLKKNPDNIDPRKILTPAREAMKEVIKEKIILFGSNGRA